MLIQPSDAEKYILITKKQDFEREIKLIKMIQTAKEYQGNQSGFQRFMEAAGWKMVKFGHRLVDRSSRC